MKRLFLILALLLSPLTANASNAFVPPGADGRDMTGDTKTSLNASAIGGGNFDVAAGNVLFVWTWYYEPSTCSSVPTITDTDTTNTFTQIGTTVRESSSATCMAYFYAKNTTVKAADVITGHYSPGISYVQIGVMQFSGLDTASPYDKNATGTAVSPATSVTSSSFTPTVTGELVAAAVCEAPDTGGIVFTAGSGFTLVTPTSGQRCAGEYKLSTDTSAQTASMSSDQAGAFTITVGTFKPAGGTGGTSTSLSGGVTLSGGVVIQ